MTLAAPIVFVACASTAPIEQEMARMRDDFRRMNSDLEATREKLARVEASVSLLASRSKAAEAAPVSVARKKKDQGTFGGNTRRLPVVRIEAPTDDALLGASDDGGAPIEIRMGPEDGAVDRLEVDHDVLSKPDPVLGSVPAPKPPAVKPVVKDPHPKNEPAPTSEPASSLTPKKEYELALAELRERALPADARGLFQAFIASHPESSLVDNARYWLGECDIAEGKYEAAIESLSKVLSDHPNSPKVPYALLRIGESWIKLGDTEQATTFLRRVTAEHVGSDAAVEANKVLKNLNSGENS
ncbi:MAG: tetratricopeptide repeat protein [Deltaproteobacteria bacterium]|nr:tetratricopeptide repeat protein [Deltaproteobacteria bacterium]